MASIFEKTMRACLENKKAATPATSKKQATSKKLVEKKITSKRFKKESEDEETFDTINDNDVETLDFADDIVAVVDPDLDADEMTSVAQGFQDIIDDTPANEIPETDEYIDDNLYGCPVCGQTFFSDKEMGDGDTCPVCGETANGFVLVGEVAATEDVEETSDEEGEEFDFDGEEIEEVPAEEEDEEEDLDEAKKARRVSRERRMARRPIRRESARAKKPMAKRVSESNLNLDEKSFNVYLNKFVRENYNNATSFTVVGARYNPQRHALTLECKINFKSGKTTKANLVCNYRKNASVMTAKDNGVFKVESKRSPFIFKVRTVGNVIKCEGMKYDFVTRTKVENKTTKVRVHSAPLTEKRAVSRPMTRRAMESRRVRRPSARTMEARRTMRRPLSRRVEATRRVGRPSARAVEARRAMRSSVRPARRVRTAESRRVVRRPSMRRSVER